ncbi:MAG TPA: hypothetical protein PKD27_08860, partial [Tepidiformaceae bacterium]|nr:hypothetical protein [Tepidiformaceae bacterium]
KAPFTVSRRGLLLGGAAVTAAANLPLATFAQEPIRMAGIYTVPVEQQWVSRIHIAAEALKPWERADPDGPGVEQARIQLALATGALSRALRGLDRWLVHHPGDPWATARREAAVSRLRELIEPNEAVPDPNPCHP